MSKTHSGDQDYSVVLCRFPVLKAETMRWLMNSLIGWTFFVINPAKITKKGKNSVKKTNKKKTKQAKMSNIPSPTPLSI